MACPDFEEVLRQGPSGHAAECEQCSALLDAMPEVDARLEAAFRGVVAPSGLARTARLRIVSERRWAPPSPLPEVLDFIAWAAILAVAVVLTPRIIPFVESAFTNFRL